MTQKSKIALVIAALVIVVGAVVLVSTDAGGLQGLIFKPRKITMDYKKLLLPCTKLVQPKISNSYVGFAKPDSSYTVSWSIKNLCGTAKVDLYTYTGEALVYSVEAGAKPIYANEAYGTGLFYYGFNGKYAGDLGLMATCIVGKPCMVKVSGGISVGYYSTEAKAYTGPNMANANNPKLKRYFLIKISDQDGNELGRSDIVAVFSETIPSFFNFHPEGINKGNDIKLKWTVQNPSSNYKLELRVYSADLLAYTAEANKKIQSVPNTVSLGYYTMESKFASALYAPNGTQVDLNGSTSQQIGPGAFEVATQPLYFNKTGALKSYFALFLKRNGEYLDKYSPVLAIFNINPTSSNNPTSKK